MAEDVREAILSRLVALLKLPGVDVVGRNINLSDDAGFETRNRKRIISILEGDEITSDQEPTTRPANTPQTVHMHPQIVLVNFAAVDQVGSGLSAMRGAVIKAIATDATLIGLTIKNRGGVYMGMESDLGFARAMLGNVALKFQFSYLLRPDQL